MYVSSVRARRPSQEVDASEALSPSIHRSPINRSSVDESFHPTMVYWHLLSCGGQTLPPIQAHTPSGTPNLDLDTHSQQTAICIPGVHGISLSSLHSAWASIRLPTMKGVAPKTVHKHVASTVAYSERFKPLQPCFLPTKRNHLCSYA